VENVTAQLDNAKKIYEASLNQVEASKQLLRNLLYLKESVSVTTIGKFTYTPKEIMFDKALVRALGQRPEIKQYEAKAKADEHALNIAKAGNLPSVDLTLDSYSGTRFITTTGIATKWKNYNVLGLTFSWPIFDGFATKAKIEQAIVDLKQSQILKEKTVQDIVLELKNSYLSLKSAISSLDSAESDAKFYKNNLASVKKKYTEGIASSLDMDDASLKYKLSIFNKQQALYDYIIAKSSLDKAEGSI
jgi:outer membrane protein TolC